MVVASASIKEGPGGDMFYFTKRHFGFLFICLGLVSVHYIYRLERWKDWSGRLLVGALGLLFAVGYWPYRQRAKRWIRFGFFNNISLAKLANWR